MTGAVDAGGYTINGEGLTPKARVKMSDDELIAEMRELLAWYLSEFPAFRSRPSGAPGSDARKAQEASWVLEDRTRAVLALSPGFQSDGAEHGV